MRTQEYFVQEAIFLMWRGDNFTNNFVIVENFFLISCDIKEIPFFSLILSSNLTIWQEELRCDIRKNTDYLKFEYFIPIARRGVGWSRTKQNLEVNINLDRGGDKIKAT